MDRRFSEKLCKWLLCAPFRVETSRKAFFILDCENSCLASVHYASENKDSRRADADFIVEVLNATFAHSPSREKGEAKP